MKASLAYPNGMTASWTYGDRNELLEVKNALGDNIASQFNYSYDAAGRRISKNGEFYSYNERSELTGAVDDEAGREYGYAFDDIGNRESAFENSVTNRYAANALNQYSAVDDFTPQYDDDGNQTLVKTSTGVWSVTYNGENRPVRWVKGDTVISMAFDRMGRRVAKNNQRFVYDGYLQVADNAGNVYVWDATENVATRPLVWNRNSDVAYYAHDGNKNVSDVIASNGDIVAHYDYAPFGAVTAQSGALASANPFGFSSEYDDRDLGLVYYNYRHYDPVTGRWTSRDPIEERGGLSLYGFVGNRVQMRFDRLGRGFFSSCKKSDGPHKKEDAEWVLDGVKLDMKPFGTGGFYIEGFYLTFTLAGEAKCCCRNWLTRRTWTETRPTQKTWTIGPIPFAQNYPAFTPNAAVPMSIPGASLGDVLGAAVQEAASNLLFTDPTSLDAMNGEIGEAAETNKPSGDGPGDWNPSDPC